ncbi:MAG: hypothetical protein QOF56_676 [Acidobacteriaceae bacterium]|jgi:hypothetical protein|nr:hypothetical protein [Acidobacteriaceae bacterium]
MGKNHIVLHISANCKARVIGHGGSRRERGSLIQLVVSCKQLLAACCWQAISWVWLARNGLGGNRFIISSDRTSGPEKLPIDPSGP